MVRATEGATRLDEPLDVRHQRNGHEEQEEARIQSVPEG